MLQAEREAPVFFVAQAYNDDECWPISKVKSKKKEERKNNKYLKVKKKLIKNNRYKRVRGERGEMQSWCEETDEGVCYRRVCWHSLGEKLYAMNCYAR